jgi:hypothetical protein
VEGGWAGERGEELGFGVVEAADGGVGDGEVGEFPAGGAMGAYSGGKFVFGEVPLSAEREVHGLFENNPRNGSSRKAVDEWVLSFGFWVMSFDVQ